MNRQTTIDRLTAGDVVTHVQGTAVKGPEHVVSRVTNIAHGKIRVTTVAFGFGGVIPAYPSTTACTVTA